MKSNLIPSQKIRIGIIGLSADGGWGASAHFPSLSKLSELFEITGLTASTPAKAQAAHKNTACRLPPTTRRNWQHAAMWICWWSPSICRNTKPCWNKSCLPAKPFIANGRWAQTPTNPAISPPWPPNTAAETSSACKPCIRLT